MTRIDKHRVTRDDREKAREVMEEMDEQVRKRSVSIENRSVMFVHHFQEKQEKLDEAAKEMADKSTSTSRCSDGDDA